MSEPSQDNSNREELLGLTSEIVAAHVSNNTVAVGDLPDLIERVYRRRQEAQNAETAFENSV